MRAGPIKERLQAGETLIGTFVRSAEPAVCEVLGLAGLDFIVLDGEHSPLGIRELAGLVRAADGVNIPAFVRVTENAPFPIMQALDMGASGVQVPQVNTEDEAAALVASAKYAPAGNRGLAVSHRAARHGFGSAVDYTRKANDNTLVVCYIETREAVERVEEISAVDGIDVLFAGPWDLSQSYGMPGQTDHPIVKEALNRVVSACEKHNKVAGTIAGNVSEAQTRAQQGFRFLAYSSDLGMLGQVAQSVLSELRGSI
jgi:4-hydroxy-2-oxoheptanedioate aldolase